MLASLSIYQYRNIRQARLEGLAAHNLIYGTNGSGKTSILEAAHILGTARSFRRGTARAQITHEEERYAIHGECVQASGLRRAMGVQRELNGSVALKIGGESSRSVAGLADELPLLLINSDSFDLLNGEPANRRRFLDWGVFHVEHAYRDGRRRFQRALTQRNHLLRRGKLHPGELDPWTAELAVHGEAVTLGRRAFLESLQVVFEALMRELSPELGELRLDYRCGWDASVSYAEALERSNTSDREQGFTQSGPQRGDVKVTVGGYSAADTLSRGQQKLVVAALKLAQGQLLAGMGPDVLFLVDDLPSELDRVHCERICRALAGTGAQSLITCVDPASIPLDWLGKDPATMFHVEHGSITRP